MMRSSPKRCRKAGTSSDPICPSAPVTRMRRISPIQRSSNTTKRYASVRLTISSSQWPVSAASSPDSSRCATPHFRGTSDFGDSKGSLRLSRKHDCKQQRRERKTARNRRDPRASMLSSPNEPSIRRAGGWGIPHDKAPRVHRAARRRGGVADPRTRVAAGDAGGRIPRLRIA